MVEQFLIVCGLILVFSLPVIIAKIHYHNPKKYFKSSEEKDGYENPIRRFRKVSEFDAKKIGIYPRLTIHNVDVSDQYNPEHLIFDSSDLKVIYKTFGLFDFPQELRAGAKIKFKEARIQIKSVEVVFYQYYDDYSENGHTVVYEGEPIPYNIQITASGKII